MSVSRTSSGGDYFSPWISLTGGQTYCAAVAIKWPGTGGMPFVGVQPSSAPHPIWIVGSAGFADAFGPVQAVSPSNSGWQQFQVSIAMPEAATQARF